MISTDELLQALQALTPDQIAGLLSQQAGERRSPLRERELTDLTLLPSKDDPRPTFYQETDGREFLPIRQNPFPKLLWHTKTGQEVTVRSAREQKDLGMVGEGGLWTDVAPITGPVDPETQARKMFAALSPEDQEFILEHQRQMKLEAVKKMMGLLTEGQQAAVLNALAFADTKDANGGGKDAKGAGRK